MFVPKGVVINAAHQCFISWTPIDLYFLAPLWLWGSWDKC